MCDIDSSQSVQWRKQRSLPACCTCGVAMSPCACVPRSPGLNLCVKSAGMCARLPCSCSAQQLTTSQASSLTICHLSCRCCTSRPVSTLPWSGEHTFHACRQTALLFNFIAIVPLPWCGECAAFWHHSVSFSGSSAPNIVHLVRHDSRLRCT